MEWSAGGCSATVTGVLCCAVSHRAVLFRATVLERSGWHILKPCSLLCGLLCSIMMAAGIRRQRLSARDWGIKALLDEFSAACAQVRAWMWRAARTKAWRG